MYAAARAWLTDSSSLQQWQENSFSDVRFILPLVTTAITYAGSVLVRHLYLSLWSV